MTPLNDPLWDGSKFVFTGKGQKGHNLPFFFRFGGVESAAFSGHRQRGKQNKFFSAG